MESILGDLGRMELVGGPYDGVADWMEDCYTAALDDIMLSAGGLVFTADDFAELVASARDRLADTLSDVGEASLAALQSLRRLNLAADRVADEYHYAIEDVADQVGALVYPGFIAGVGAARIGEVARYLDAASNRLQRLPENPGRDAELMARARELEVELDDLIEVLPWDPRMIDVTWMLQELRVSFFAQHLGVKGKVSEKRTREALAELAKPADAKPRR